MAGATFLHAMQVVSSSISRHSTASPCKRAYPTTMIGIAAFPPSQGAATTSGSERRRCQRGEHDKNLTLRSTTAVADPCLVVGQGRTYSDREARSA